MKKDQKHLGLRIDDALHYKLQYLARYEGRSINGQVLYTIRQAIAAFEKEHGAITLPDSSKEA